MKIVETKNSKLLKNLQTSLLEESLSSLQVSKHVDEVREKLNKYFPSLFEDLNVYSGQEYRWKATRRIVAIILNNPEEMVHSSIWRKLLLTDPVFKWIENYPIVSPYHKYRNHIIYQQWLDAEPCEGFLQLFTD
jgi:hypothetical protein